MHVAVDVGGTFTDLVVAYEDGSVVGYKTPSTKPDIIQGFFNGIDLIASQNGVTTQSIFDRLTRIDFGTTAATNAILEGKAARTGLIVTEGFRDVLVVREGGKEDTYNMHAEYPQPYVPRALTFEIGERMTAEGDVLKPLDEASVLKAIEDLRAEKVEAVAVSLIWSISNPAHELRIAELIREHLPEVQVSVSHEVNPCLREHRRTISCALDASLKPLAALNIASMKRRLEEVNYKGKLTYITSSGGKAAPEDVLRRPVYLCFSGPSAAPESGRRFARMEGDLVGNIITVDMGGTSFDVSITTKGELPMHRAGTIAGHIFGVPSVEIHTIGSGGGSIARVDAGGFVHVGPESAGSYPGPACYSRGGTRPTVTDANLLSGYLNENFVSGGGMTLSRDLSKQVVEEHISSRLNISNDEAAGLTTFACEQDMVAAIEDLTVRRGVDPREYIMVAGGAAAGAHAVAMAREIGIKRVILPKMAGVLSAFGILAGDATFGFARSVATTTGAFDVDTVRKTLQELKAEGERFLTGLDVAPEARRMLWSCQARYRAQVWELTLPFDASDLDAEDPGALLSTRFHKLHRSLYQSASEDEDVEITEWNVLAIGKLTDIRLPDISAGHLPKPPTSSRRAYFRELSAAVDVPVYGPMALEIDRAVEGPLIIDEVLTTIVVGPKSSVTLTRYGNYVVDIQ
ncbi:hydantoinase/oxoprolinase family protein [Mesorhizobium sp. LHD-90]|uniref:hydantoinase/oxoprolinase family protein n=1 Tax=Mesorhizobium sp. LHD-90 TaxID=3071414 RepID=UPI0027E050AC|nr:hydantoinase/oxoprolinase family protein [Mesorhizobium sp. LHD-90]MDQ6433213.1 hydantoinase/oxoprolinase family protein [Mesorhizobium sp. LHD-90]